MSAERAAAIVESLTLLPVIPITSEIVQTAIRLRQRYQISYWDGAIIAAAKELGASTVYSEDLAHGQVYDGVTVLNPFLPDVE